MPLSMAGGWPASVSLSASPMGGAISVVDFAASGHLHFRIRSPVGLAAAAGLQQVTGVAVSLTGGQVYIERVYVGPAAAAGWDFAAPPTGILFSGSWATISVAAGQTVTSDLAPLSIDPAAALMVSIQVAATSDLHAASSSIAAGWTAAGNADRTNAAGQTVYQPMIDGPPLLLSGVTLYGFG